MQLLLTAWRTNIGKQSQQIHAHYTTQHAQLHNTARHTTTHYTTNHVAQVVPCARAGRLPTQLIFLHHSRLTLQSSSAGGHHNADEEIASLQLVFWL